jgi:hypothetical protein
MSRLFSILLLVMGLCLLSAFSLSCAKDKDDDPPPSSSGNSSAQVTTPTGTVSGLVLVDFTLLDPESEALAILVEYSTDGGSSFFPAFKGPGGAVTAGLASSAAGTAYVYVWNSFQDGVATGAANSSVVVRITPSDAAAGTSDQTVSFTVDNSLLSSGGFVGSPYPILSDPTAGEDRFCAMASDGTYLYLVGGAIPSDEEWRIEKRDFIDGSLVGTFGSGGVEFSDPSTGDDRAIDVVISGSHLYVAGTEWIQSGPDSYAWRVEKRSLVDGTLDVTFGTGGAVVTPGLGDFDVVSIAADSSHFYLAGCAEAAPIGGGDVQFRIEKRSLADGSLDSNFGSSGVIEGNPNSAMLDGVMDVIVQGGYLYLAGGRALDMGSPSTSDSEAFVQKRSVVDGALDPSFGASGEVVFDDSAGNDFAISLATDGTSIFVLVTRETAQGTDIHDWVLEKRDLATGATGTGQLLNVQKDRFSPIGALFHSGSHVYTGTLEDNAGDRAWNVQKRAVSDLSLDTAFASSGILLINPSLSDDRLKSLHLEGGVLFVGGREDTGASDYGWRVEAVFE